jgi:hypothetical protein
MAVSRPQPSAPSDAGAAMREADQRGQTVTDDVVSRFTGNPGHEANAARVVMHARLSLYRFDK